MISLRFLTAVSIHYNISYRPRFYTRLFSQAWSPTQYTHLFINQPKLFQIMNISLLNSPIFYSPQGYSHQVNCIHVVIRDNSADETTNSILMTLITACDTLKGHH